MPEVDNTGAPPAADLGAAVDKITDAVAAEAVAVLADTAAKIEAAQPQLAPVVAAGEKIAEQVVSDAEVALKGHFASALSGERVNATVEEIEAKALALVGHLRDLVKQEYAKLTSKT